MKIFVECECELLQASLEIFLKDFLASKDEADFIVCDTLLLSQKPTFCVGSDISLPFTNAQLIARLDDFVRKNTLNIRSIEVGLDEILARFKSDLIELFRHAR